ncbi:NERD domain-containing protein [Halobacillus sp. GSS1]|uniref:nuclease-related domain-containing protein n=1 Tax=Halobacillus sp. GSS1 TaxID=2815919 RepID=UPI001A8C1AD8|nr:nuclease-related domain-containing protein [Halobacillus sp. GSS1]MBN9656269.1 NERD domain-containing protein [Halobacillus sp. GSS1]
MPREKSLELLKLESLLNRISTHHPLREEIANRLGHLSAGHFGETTADHYMEYLPGRSMQDVRLHDGVWPFQIDALLLYQECLVLIEIKNYKGELQFDLDHRKLISTVEGKSEVFQDPFVQVELQKFQLQRWLKMSSFPSIPIYSFVVIANSNASLTFQGEDFSKRKRVHSDVILEYGLSKDELNWGVPCPSCRMLGMARRRDHWLCGRFGTKSKDAHLLLLRDHQLLIGDTITNAEFRVSAGIGSLRLRALS